MFIEQPPWFFRAIYPDAIFRMDPDEKAVYLTFDDGPIPEVTPWVLELLDKHNIKATFFMVGDNIRKHPDVFRMVVERGHRIGNHTFNHIRGFEYLSSNYLANTNNTAAFSPKTTLSTTIRMVPFAGARTITVHFNTLTISGRTVPNNTEITSTQSIQLKEGKSYTMKIQFKKTIGINVPSGSINLTTNGCSSADKTALAKLIWADGNLKSTGSANYVWGTYSEYGYYYTWKSTYTGNASTNNTDPCPKLKSDYGTGWRTPSKDEMDKLSRCTNKAVVTNGGNKGFWFMNSTIGLFLPFGGSHGGATGSKTTPPGNAGSEGAYWCLNANGSTYGYLLYLTAGGESRTGYFPKTNGQSVRCVKNK